MKKILLISIPLFCAIYLFSSCTVEPSESVDQDRIYTAYDLIYDKNENKTYAKASFRFGNVIGTLLKLNSTSEIKFNNDVLEYRSAGYYEKEYTGLVAGGTFTFKDAKGTIYTNVVPALKSIDFPAEAISISRGNSYTLNWVGDNLTSGENVSVSIGTEVFLQTKANTNSINLSSDQLTKLMAGPSVARMERSSVSEPTQKPSAGGMITHKYRAGNKSIQITN